MDYLLALVAAGVSLIYAFHWWKKINHRSLPYPPGPPAHPLIGNIRQIPADAAWLTYAKWKKEYGDVISVEAFGNRIVVVNSAKAAFEIFDKRGAIYSERPYIAMIQDLMAIQNLFFMPYDDTLRSQRKLLNAALNPTPVVNYIDIQERESYALLGRLLDEPDRFYKHIRRTTASIILTIAYGHPVVTDDDDYVHLAESTANHIRRAIRPTSFLVNLIPALKHIPAWMPLTGFHRFARKGRQLNDTMREKPFHMVKSQMMEGAAPHSYTSRLLEAKGSITARDDEEYQIKSTAAVLYGAGSETTMVAVVTFILAMIMHPEVQRKAQQELDTVLGGSRLPTLADKSSLPYLNYVVSEVLRWQPVTALGLPHSVREDDVYDNYLIPKGSVVIGNIWAMTHDEELYQDPMRFWPERFDGRFPAIKDPRQFVFGFGRRLCPGRHLALNSVFIAIACLVSTYDLSKARDAEGNEVEPRVDYSQGGAPQPFECRITPRSKEAVSLLRATLAANES